MTTSLEAIIAGLTNRLPPVREESALKLKQYVVAQTQEMSAQDFNNFVDNLITGHLVDVMNIPVPINKLGVMLAMDKLNELELDAKVRFTRTTELLHLALLATDTQVVLLASQQLGRMAQANPTEGPIEKELEVALRNMKKDSHRYGGALVLKELARSAPTLFYLHVSEFFDCVGEGLKDPNIAVRECTLEALRCALSLVSHREHNHRHQWYHAIYQDAFEGLMAKSVTPAVVHGSLLTMGELLVATDWMEPRYRVLCEKVLQFKDNKDKMVVNTVITLLPILANFSPQQFNELLLKDAVAWLLAILEKKGDTSKPEAFLALGQIAKASGKQSMKPYVAAAMERVGESLDPKKLSSSQALQCLGLLAEAMGSDILVTVSTVELLSKMFSSGLTGSLIGCLRQLSGTVSALLPRIQEALMDEISWILAGKAFANFQQNDAVSLKKSVALAGAVRPVLPMRYTYPDKDKPTQLALETLATFNLQVNVYNVAEFIREIVVSFLDDDEPDIRQAAARTCTAIMGGAEQTDRKMAPMVNEVVEKLLIVGISDAEPKIRETVFSCLKHGFDQYLVEPENLRLLFIALNDQVFKIRELAITIIGRLTVTDPGNVMPSLRKTLIQLVTGLELSNNRTKEESARLLGSLIRSSHHLIKPYVGPILDTLLLELLHSSTRSPAVGSHVFATIGELARVGRETVVPHLHYLIPLILDTLKQGPIPRREAAMRALGQLACATGYVIEPYHRYPDLLDLILNEVKTQQLPSMRIEVVKVLGILGALDPYTHKLQQIRIQRRQESGSKQTLVASTYDTTVTTHSESLAPQAHQLVKKLRATTAKNQFYAKISHSPMGSDKLIYNLANGDWDHFYLGRAVNSLLAILKSPHSEHDMVANTLVKELYDVEGVRLLPYLPEILPPFLQLLQARTVSMRARVANTTDAKTEKLFQHLKLLITIARSGIKAYIYDIFALVKENWHTPLFRQSIRIVRTLAKILGEEFRVFVPEILPLLLTSLLNDARGTGSISPQDLPRNSSLANLKESSVELILPMAKGSGMQRKTSLAPMFDHRVVFVLRVLEVFGSCLADYLHLLVPTITRLFDDEQLDVSSPIQARAMQTLGLLCAKLKFSEYASHIIHPLAKLIDREGSAAVQLRKEAMDTLCALIPQLQSDFAVFIPMIRKLIVKHRIQHASYENLISRLLKNQALTDDPQPQVKDVPSLSRRMARRASLRVGRTSPSPDGGASPTGSFISAPSSPGDDASRQYKPPATNKALKEACQTMNWITKEDWEAWLSRLRLYLLEESHSPSLRACYDAAVKIDTLAKDLFNVAFICWWNELTFFTAWAKNKKLDGQFRYHVVSSFTKVMTSQRSLPPEILQILLNLCEFMERHGKPLSISTSVLGGIAEKCEAWAKALHYKEIEFRTQPGETCEALISINHKLDLPEAAAGVLHYAQEVYHIEQESWYEKLQRWETALAKYEAKQSEEPANTDYTMGRMRCLNAMAEWKRLAELSEELWKMPTVDTSVKKKMAAVAACAAWNMAKWSDMKTYVEFLPEDTVNGSFYRAVLEIHQNNFDASQAFIDRTRELLDPELRAQAGESYTRAYKAVVRAQLLSEMEELMDYKKMQADGVKDNLLPLRNTWTKRLKGMQKNIEVWQESLLVRSMAINPEEDAHNWLKFASLCRKSGRPQLAHNTLIALGGAEPSPPGETSLQDNKAMIRFAWLKHCWHTTKVDENSEREQLFQRLRDLCRTVNKKTSSTKKLLAQCYLTLANWERDLNEGLTEPTINSILRAYEEATQYDGQWYKACHSWAMFNFEVISHWEKQDKNRMEAKDIRGKLPDRKQHNPKHTPRLLTSAVRGFFRSIALAPQGKSLQDTLRLLTLWFEYGHMKVVEETLIEGFTTVSVDTWLQVIPQLIARIHSSVASVARLTHDLLTNVGRAHPQALVYPLSVASKSDAPARVTAANYILDKMREHSDSLVEAALLVSHELIRVAIPWQELWKEGIEEAWQLYSTEKNVEGMVLKLHSLNQLITVGAQTPRETTFMHMYGRDLAEAFEWLQRYQKTKDTTDLHQAWEYYFLVFRSLSTRLPNIKTIEMQHVSPKLMAVRDLGLIVPGTYEGRTQDDDIVKISHFLPTLTVLASKQRPCKLTIMGSDGKEYPFLLKGHEDLRQDERVMQLFELVNTLLATDRETTNRQMAIQRYAIIPLSPHSGLIGWVPHHDTLHELIANHRKAKDVPITKEHVCMLRLVCGSGVKPNGEPMTFNDYVANFEKLTTIQKAEIFESGIAETEGDDLDQVLWLKSPNSEVWLDRRTNYTRSLAVMSMVGYILGLGDRHPSNIMLDRNTGKITHIDFGDCFEVAMMRDKHKEKIPFRLTRMLIRAMEVTGIEGNFRCTAENVMRVLRENKDSVIAVLEAFVHDPLINWRLLQQKVPSGQEAPTDSTLDDNGGVDLNDHPAVEAAKIEVVSGSVFGSKLERRVSPGGGEAVQQDGMLNEKALEVVDRIASKLRGKDFETKQQRAALSVRDQVSKLIDQATSTENLSQCYHGWCPFW